MPSPGSEAVENQLPGNPTAECSPYGLPTGRWHVGWLLCGIGYWTNCVFGLMQNRFSDVLMCCISAGVKYYKEPMQLFLSFAPSSLSRWTACLASALLIQSSEADRLLYHSIPTHSFGCFAVVLKSNSNQQHC